jgi:hypothetical protein
MNRLQSQLLRYQCPINTMENLIGKEERLNTVLTNRQKSQQVAKSQYVESDSERGAEYF